MIPGLFGGGESNFFMIIQTVITLLFFVMIFFFPRIMLWQIDRKMRSVLDSLDEYRVSAENMFLEKFASDMSAGVESKYESLKNIKMSQPTNLDPAGMVGRLEHVLDTSEDKFKRFVEGNADTEDSEELADLNMAFKGVMGTHQIYKVVRHFRKLIKGTQNIQLIGMIRMMLPLYEELAESQKDATRAFLDQAPIGDAIGPLVAAKMITEEPEEVADNIMHSEEEINDQTVHVLKSDGPGARLGKYGDAIDTLAEENDLEAIVTVDAALKFEGEETGSVAEGVGVMMGGPGVEKSKIEEAATEHEIPLEGVVIKQSAPEASKAMKKEIFDAYKDAKDKAEELASEFDGEVAVVGVGNTCGVGNVKDDTRGIHNRLRKYWKEYEEEEEEVSYMGMMSILPGADQASMKEARNSLIWRTIR
ncbi:DUF1512 family protein [Candidatus Nanosalina sp. VS9-1]|uniref:DUF1512 family protein n=1 Tax=Candidatus Nanosalina sp. VS9-1 TaxID=3388566 RepID=UPI0039DF8FCE